MNRINNTQTHQRGGRQRITLNENQLRQIIKEALLNELDWKTYANAAKKAKEQHRDSRWDFDRATEKALDQKYGGRHSVSTGNDTYQRFHTYNDNPFSTDYDCAWRPLEGHEDFGNYADRYDNKKPYGADEIADFVNGKYDYVKGKGWQLKDNLKENRMSRIIRESIGKVLREDEEFVPQGGCATSNWGGMEIQIADSGDAARFRSNYGDDSIGAPTDWLEIEYDEEGEPYCELPNGDIEYLSNYMRYNR